MSNRLHMAEVRGQRPSIPLWMALCPLWYQDGWPSGHAARKTIQLRKEMIGGEMLAPRYVTSLSLLREP